MKQAWAEIRFNLEKISLDRASDCVDDVYGCLFDGLS